MTEAGVTIAKILVSAESSSKTDGCERTGTLKKRLSSINNDETSGSQITPQDSDAQTITKKDPLKTSFSRVFHQKLENKDKNITEDKKKKTSLKQNDLLHAASCHSDKILNVDNAVKNSKVAKISTGNENLNGRKKTVQNIPTQKETHESPLENKEGNKILNRNSSDKEYRKTGFTPELSDKTHRAAPPNDV